MPTTLWMPPNTAMNASGEGESWAEPTGIVAEGGNQAFTYLATGAGSRALVATGFDWSSVPADASILGIAAKFKRWQTPESQIGESRISLVRAGVIEDENLADSVRWGNVEIAWSEIYGGADDCWNAVWTRADVLDSDFGLAITAHNWGEVMGTAFIDAVLLQLTYDITTGNWSAAGDELVLTVDASGIIPPTGQTIIDYCWDWDDGSVPTHTALDTCAHRYHAAGAYSVTLTVTLSGGGTRDFTKEIYMASITKVTPLMAKRGDTITIAGAGFGATQSTGTVTMGGKALTDVTWADAQISGKVAVDCAYGPQDAVVTPASGAAATLTDALYVYDATDNKDIDEVALGIVDHVYLNGAQVGFTQDALDMTFRTREVEFEPADRFDVVQVWSYTGPSEVRVTFAQLDGALLQQLLGGAWSETDKVFTLAANAQYPELSLAIKEASGVMHVFKRVKVTGDLSLSLNKEVKRLPVTFKVLSLNDSSARKYECSLP